MKRLKRFILLVIILIFTASANAAVPTTMTYQGKLTDSAGVPLNSAVGITFIIYDADTGGTTLWTETLSSIIVTNGIFTVTLGETSAINSSVFTGTEHFLGVAVNAEAEMTPRQKLTSVAFAVQAQTATIADTAIIGQDLSCTSCVSVSELDFDPATQSELDTAISGIADNDTLDALACVDGQIAKWNGTVWSCAVDALGITAESDPSVNSLAKATLTCTSGEIAKWDGTAWSCAVDNDTVVTAPLSLNGANIGGSIITGTNTSTGDYAIGLKGVGSSTSGINYGLWGQSFSSAGTGVYGRAALYGLYGTAYDISGINYGVYGTSASPSGFGVYGANTNGGLAAKFDGDVEVVGVITGDGSGLTNLPGGSSGTVTSVATGTGLTGGPITATGTISISAGGVGSTEIATGAVTATKIPDNTITGAHISDGTIVSADLADDALTLAKINQNGCVADQIMKWNGSAWACAADDDTDVTAPFLLTDANAGAGIITGTNSDTTGSSSGVMGLSTATTGSTFGVWGKSDSISGKGVSGWAMAATGTTYGVQGVSSSPDGFGIYGINVVGGLAAKFDGDVEVVGKITGDGSGLTGISSANVTAPFSLTGANAATSTIAGTNTDTATLSSGVRGISTATTGATYGVWAQNASTSGRGVLGWATASSGTTYGVHGESASPSGYGVYGKNTNGGLAAKFDGDVDIAGNLSITNPLTLSGANAGIGTITGTNSDTTGSSTGIKGLSAAATGSTVGVWGLSESSSGKGLLGSASSSTGTTYGVFGTALSSDGTGVYGTNSGGGLAAKFEGDVDIIGNLSITEPLSLTGATDSTGTITGTNSSDYGIGVHGIATATSGSASTIGVYGQSASSLSGSGVRGSSTATTGSTYGVYGSSASESGKGVYGEATALTGTTYGVYGSSVSTSGGAGVMGSSSSPNGRGVYGLNSGGGYAGFFSGRVHVDGTFTATTKSFIQPHAKDPSKEIVYISAEAPEAMVMYRGTATLINGEATVIFPEYFALVAASKGLQVQVTPRSIDTYGLAVIQRNNENIVVKEFKDGKGTFEFDYFVTAVRAGFEDHKPVIANRDYKPKPYETKAEFEARFAGDDLASRAIRNMLISNGILEDGGTINMDTIEKLGWSFAN